MTTAAKIITTATFITALSWHYSQVAKDCSNWNQAMDEIDTVRQNLFANPVCQDESLPLSERIALDLPAYDPQSENSKKCKELMNQSLEAQNSYHALLSKQPRHCKRKTRT